MKVVGFSVGVYCVIRLELFILVWSGGARRETEKPGQEAVKQKSV